MIHTREDWQKKFEEMGALWFWDWNLKRPHVRLNTGFHTGSFFKTSLVTADKQLLLHCAHDLFELFLKSGGASWSVSCVVGPNPGGGLLAESLSDRAEMFYRSPCFSASPMFMPIVRGLKYFRGELAFDDKDRRNIPGKLVLVCDDVIYSGGTAGLTFTKVEELRGNLVPFVAVLVNFSGLTELSGKKVVSILDIQSPTWEPDDCQLCRAGSEAINPETESNWKRLTAVY